MNKATQRVLFVSRQLNETFPDSYPAFSLAQLIFSQESNSNSSSNMRMRCCSTSC